MHQKKTNSISDYIQGNLERKNVRWRLKDGQWMFEIHPKIWGSEEMFDLYYPSYEYIKFNDKGMNPDKTKIK
jgi:hypothetical protein